MKKNKKKVEPFMDERPPVFKKWNSVYLVVFINLVVLIILFFLFTKVFE